ncbi:MAG TPA: hypothetical protein VK129_06190 [Terriglobales bacterium]|nr:hypothetical protein [Terriglobales bacterium]
MMTRISSLASLYILLLAVMASADLAAQTRMQAQNIEMAALQPHLAWQRTSPTAQHPDGPVLYQIIFRSSATPGSIPKIGNNFTLTNSLITDNGSQVAIGNLSIASGGIISFANGQTFPGTGSGTVTSAGLAAPASDFIVSNSPVTGAGTLTLAWNTAPTSTNTVNAIVKRDANGSFSAGAINASSTITSLNAATSNIAIIGHSSATTGFGIGVEGVSDSASSTAGVFNNTLGGKILSLQNNGGELVSISGGNTTISASSSTAGMILQARSLATSGFTTGIYGESNSPIGYGASFVNNNAAGKILAGLGPGSSEVFDVYASGAVTASSNTTNATITGHNSNAGGQGIAGTGNIGVYGLSGSNFSLGFSGNAAIWGDGRTGTTYGVVGTSTGNTATGTAGLSDSGTGVLAKSNTGLGLHAVSNSLSGIAAFLENPAGGDILIGESSNGFDVLRVGGTGFLQITSTTSLADIRMGDPGCGQGFTGIGFGALSSCNNYAIVGDNVGTTYINSSGNGHGIHFRHNNGDQMTIDEFGTASIGGSLQVGGSLGVVGTKNFRIDHPLAPAEKYLVHASIESSEVMDLYSGNVVLDRKGEAWVQLPDWFEALNQDFRYALTAIGAPGPNLYIAREIQDHRFKIAGGKPLSKVSWQVTGVRHDAYMAAHPMQVEEDKGTLRGTYLHPELFGQPPSKQATRQAQPSAAVTKSGGQ